MKAAGVQRAPARCLPASSLLRSQVRWGAPTAVRARVNRGQSECSESLACLSLNPHTLHIGAIAPGLTFWSPHDRFH